MAELLAIPSALLPGGALRRYGPMLLTVVALISTLSLSLYTFGDAAWNQSFYVAALLVQIALVAAAHRADGQPQPLRVAAACAAITWPILFWVGTVLASD